MPGSGVFLAKVGVTSIALSALAGLSPTAASAQTLPSIDARSWRPSSDAEAGMVLEPTTTPGPWQWNVGVWTHYAQSPVTLKDPGAGGVTLRPLDHALGADVVAGVGLGRRAAVGVDVPVLLWQDGNGVPESVVTGGAVPGTGFGDVALRGKATLVSDDRQGVHGGFGLALLGGLTLPTGQRRSFAGEGAVTVSLGANAEYAAGVGAVRAGIAYDLRTEQRRWPLANVGGVPFGDEIAWWLGVVVRAGAIAQSLDSADRQLWEIALHGALPASPVAPFGLGRPGASALSPVLAAADDRIAIGRTRDFYVLVGADVGLDDAVGVPTFRAVASFGWAPRAHDRDGDGIPDDVDECPDLPEDKDGIQDADGCPEDDADSDGILDTEDACPLVAGVHWDDVHKNGCPAPDTDSDGVPDPVDACPAVKGTMTDDPKTNGCPIGFADRDHDGIPDDADKCPDEPEDRDGYQDFDGCPDRDDDADGVPDKEDACPREKGPRSLDAAQNGCPRADRDGDTYDDAVDRCPAAPEVFNGIDDEDGCPDVGGHPLAAIEAGAGGWVVSVGPISFAGTSSSPGVDIRSVATLRALAQQLNRHPDWTLAVGVRPSSSKATAAVESRARAAAITAAIVRYTHRSSAAQAVDWNAVAPQTVASSTTVAPSQGAGGEVAFAVLATAPRPTAGDK
ncbi:MAG: thrombospondin type 3 repeat-containing protein [Myxococcota bacterium]|nr:thrombospondin type 3 repeat-containing protein [Myxococcota bacterium]